jgi:hypothetical protein
MLPRPALPLATEEIINWRQRFPDDGFKREVAGGGTAGGEWVKFAAYAARQRRRADE